MGLSLRGRTAVITGATGALGRAFALQLAGLGANIVINDIGSSLSGASREGASSPTDDASGKLLRDIIALGQSRAIINRDNVLNGQAIIDSAVKEFGKVDILINNAGILRDKSFHKMTDDDWYKVIDVHLHGSYSCTKAAWSIMMANNFGRIINISSGAGLYGNFGQSSYSSAKMALVGLTKTLAKEGSKCNINVNALVPVAHSRMTETVLPKDILGLIQPAHIAPIAAALCAEHSLVSGGVFEVGGGWFSEVRIQRSRGIALGSTDMAATPQELLAAMDQIRDFSGSRLSSGEDNPTCYPVDPADALKAILASRTGDALNKTSPRGYNWLDAATSAAATAAVSGEAEPASGSIVLKIDAVFDAIRSRMASDEFETIAKVIDVRIKFAISKKGGVDKYYLLDMKAEDKRNCLVTCDNGDVSKVSLAMSDETACQLFSGELSAEFAYVRGLLKIDGGMKHALKVKTLLQFAAGERKK